MGRARRAGKWGKSVRLAYYLGCVPSAAACVREERESGTLANYRKAAGFQNAETAPPQESSIYRVAGVLAVN